MQRGGGLLGDPRPASFSEREGMRLDLHIHTTASDGAWAPEKVVEAAARGGLDVIAIADHDTTAGVRSAQEAGAAANVQVIPALEVSSTWQRREIHVLGYFVDPAAPSLAAQRSTMAWLSWAP